MLGECANGGFQSQYRDGAVAVELNLVGPLSSLGELRDEGAVHRRDETGFPGWQGRELSGRALGHSFSNQNERRNSRRSLATKVLIRGLAQF